MGFGAFNIGATGMRAMQQAMDIRSANIANANTPGYRRQDAAHTELFNGGVTTSSIHRFNPVTATRISTLAGESAQSTTHATELQSAEYAISDLATTVTESMGKLNELLFTAGLTPSAPGLREGIVGQAKGLAAIVNQGVETLDNQLLDVTKDINGVTQQGMAKLNELAELNRQVMYTGSTPELKNQMAQVGREAAELIGGEVRFEDNGTASFVSGMQYLVNNSDVAEKLPLQVGGKLAGLQNAKTELTKYRGDVANQISQFSSAMNAFNTSGTNAAGAAGSNLFSFNGDTLTFVGTKEDLALSAYTPARQASLDGAMKLGTGLATTAGSIGIDSAAALGVSSAKKSTLAGIDERQQAEEGVDVDSEMLALKIAQKIYEANAKVIQTADAMFSTLLSIKA